MTTHTHTVAFLGIEGRVVDVQVHVSSGLPSFQMVGLPDKAVAESRERIRAALNSLGLGLPPKRITVNLAPASLPKEGSHYDIPIALGLLTELDILHPEHIADYISLGELSLDGNVSRVNGVLAAAMTANRLDKGLICPQDCGAEAALSGINNPGRGGCLATPSLMALINHFKNEQTLEEVRTESIKESQDKNIPNISSIRGQDVAIRALKIAAAGGHNMLMVGPPGSGKSMLAAALPGILPPLTPKEALEVHLIHSLHGSNKPLSLQAPFRSPHYSSSMVSLIGGGRHAKPGEISLSHHGVLFLDEFPEFQRHVTEALRQPLEAGSVTIARAEHHVTYPASIQLIAAMNPCKCGFAGDPKRSCGKEYQCRRQYQSRISGPLLDRIDLRIDVGAVSPENMLRPKKTNIDSQTMKQSITQARKAQWQRYGENILNARAPHEQMESACQLDASLEKFVEKQATHLGLSGRGLFKVLRVARTIADLEHNKHLNQNHLTEAFFYRSQDSMMPS